VEDRALTYSAMLRDLKARRPWTHPVWEHNPKLAARDFALYLGLRVPLLIGFKWDVRDLPQPPAPAVVIKPNHGGGSACVAPLVRDGGMWRSLLGDGSRDWRGWLRHLHTKSQKRPRTYPHPDNVGPPWLVEEMVGGGIPTEWKCYTVGGVVQFVAQFQRDPESPRSTSRRSICYRDRDMAVIPGGVRADTREVVALPDPAFPAEIIEAAERVARALPTNFVRVDLYEDAYGVVFSEITPEPGGLNRLNPEWDARVGAAWVAAGGVEACL
jgi:hypothetical protein